jgi:hypothetical protein
VATTTHIILQNTWAEVEYHLDICHVTRNAKCITKRFWGINFPLWLPVIWTHCIWYLKLIMLKPQLLLPECQTVSDEEGRFLFSFSILCHILLCVQPGLLQNSLTHFAYSIYTENSNRSWYEEDYQVMTHEQWLHMHK